MSGCRLLIGAGMVVLRLKQLMDGGATAGIRVEYLHLGLLLLLSCSRNNLYRVDHFLGDVLHGLHKLLLMHLSLFDVCRDNHATARVL